MIANKRPADALSVLELAVLFTLYPVHHDNDALAAWHQSLASNSTIFAAWVAPPRRCARCCACPRRSAAAPCAANYMLHRGLCAAVMPHVAGGVPTTALHACCAAGGDSRWHAPLRL